MKQQTILLLLIAIMATSCSHDKTEAGGTGGSATVKVFPQHHGRTAVLDSMKVFVKYNSLDAPANGIYDDSITCTRQDTVVFGSFPGLKNGKYYFYSKGYDTSIQGRVKGGIPYTIALQRAQEFNLPVSED